MLNLIRSHDMIASKNQPTRRPAQRDNSSVGVVLFLSTDFPEITDKPALVREFSNGRVIPSEPVLHRNNDES